MNRKALLLSLVLAAAGVTVLMFYMRRFEREMSGGERVALLMLAQPLARGQQISEEVLSVRNVPVAYVEDRDVKARERSKVIGLRTSVALSPQQTLMWTDLAITTEERDLSSLVQPGKRAVTVRATGAEDLRGNALIRPGDYVDVIVTMTEGQDRSQQAQQASAVLLQKVLVLAVGTDTGATSISDPKQANANNREKALTLSLSLQEAQLLALAVERGRLGVAVRNPDDQRVVENVPDMRSTVLLDTLTRESVQRPRAKLDGESPVRIQGVTR
jgi:pilus assembly protein CpaB